MDEFWSWGVKYSIIHELWVKKFNVAGWVLQPALPGRDLTTAGEQNRFHLTYPSGTFLRPAVGVEYIRSIAGSKSSGLGVHNETSRFLVHVLGDDMQIHEVERWLVWVKTALHDTRIPLYKWHDAREEFTVPWTLHFKLRYVQDQVTPSHAKQDKPEGVIEFEMRR